MKGIASNPLKGDTWNCWFKWEIKGALNVFTSTLALNQLHVVKPMSGSSQGKGSSENSHAIFG